jgi:hypothetical protein
MMRRSGWHPLVELKVRQLGRWHVLQGIDPIDNHRCQILTETDFHELAPTFVRVDEPGRLTCSIEQLQCGKVSIVRGRGWFGVSNPEEARVAKAARSGDLSAMRGFAQSRSYRHLGRDNRTSDVAQFLDLQAALFWFEKAAKSGSEEAKLEHAYLLDLIDLDAAYRKWRRDNPKLSPRLAPSEIRTPPPGTLAHAVCVRASERLQHLKDLIDEREESGEDWMDDYYLEEMLPGEEYLNGVAGRPQSPRLGEAIKLFLARTQVPPFEA